MVCAARRPGRRQRLSTPVLPMQARTLVWAPLESFLSCVPELRWTVMEGPARATPGRRQTIYAPHRTSLPPWNQ